ncbi:hypothetical protein VOLCADRAFT_91868 [Volvox carteri f. nagariensis]|uniref:Uncharacterized protein n=1 Tax=Volvox carteri f. nagariensis TaxID=3068 RepID=D8TY63_VOLCA|nr:uncharacterized protein VOLCADRAFT_91868 [Volvox carteri f. nagariensis]EFJ47494.1 hypothetical protein VOLCADRAFT_91868 [Volvox carteri f. nagariensis]|eukprot:XP_002951318.1 hypothetical protein VOLCADRAFT_91868 [Volvox carteri f. nagariensis]
MADCCGPRLPKFPATYADTGRGPDADGLLLSLRPKHGAGTRMLGGGGGPVEPRLYPVPAAGTGGLSGLRLLLATAAAPPPPPAAAPSPPLPQPMASASRRSSLLATSPSGKGFLSVVAAATTASVAGGAAAGDACGPAAAGNGGDKNESLADWVAHRFRTSSRRDVQAPPTTEAAAPNQLPRSLPGSGGSAGGEACGGLRGLLAARTDGAGSWYARPTRWHDPLSPAGALHTSVLDLRQSPHGSGASHVLGTPASLAPLEHHRKGDGLPREIA